ncbi:MAG: tetratricopeptide repeat protein [Saprospiraceae bacterium]
MENAIHKEYADQVQTLFRFLERTNRGSFYFAVSNDEKLQREVSNTLQFLALGKDKKVLIFNWDQQVASIHPLQLLKSTLAAHPETSGLILLGNDTALRYNPAFFTQLNFSREALLQLGIPILFWLSKRTLALLNQQALDIYNQRAGTNVYFEYAVETTDPEQLMDLYVVQEVMHDNEELRQYEARVKLLQEQLLEAKSSQISKVELANGIVIDLLELYAKIPRATALAQRLIDDYSTAFDDSLPRTCFVLGVVYDYLRNIHQAQIYYEKALALYRKLGQNNWLKFSSDWAKTLNNFGVLLLAKNEFELAESAYQEALGIYQKLVQNDSKAFLPYMASTMNNLASLYRDRNEFGLAENTYKEALDIYQELTLNDSQVFLHDMALTLNNLGNLYKDKNEFEPAEDAFFKSLEILRKLAQSNPQIFSSDVAMALNNIGVLHIAKNEFDLAERAYRESLDIYRKLARSNPQAFLPYVAGTLNNLAAWHKSKNEFDLAENAFLEALDIQRKLAQSNPQNFMHSVAMTLNNIGNLHSSNNKIEEARNEYSESLDIYRELAKSNPAPFLPNVALLATNFSLFYQKRMPNKERSLAYAKEALRAAQPFISFFPDTKKHADRALKVITDWGEDPDTFLQELAQEKEGA